MFFIEFLINCGPVIFLFPDYLPIIKPKCYLELRVLILPKEIWVLLYFNLIKVKFVNELRTF